MNNSASTRSESHARRCAFLVLQLLLLLSLSFPTTTRAHDAASFTALGKPQGTRLSIGVVLPLTGDFSTASGSLRRGIEAAATTYGHHVIFEDDGGLEPARAAIAVRKLLHIDHVNLVILCSYDVVPAVSPVLEQARVPAVVLWDNNQELTNAYPYVFSIGYAPEQAGAALGHFITQHLKGTRVAVVAADTKWSEALSSSLVEKARARGASVVAEHRVPVDLTDFRALLTHLIDKQPDALVAPLYSRGIVSFIRQARALGYKGAILTGETLFEHELHSLGGAAEGVYMTNAWLSSQKLAALPRNHTEQNIPDCARFALAFDAMTLAEEYSRDLTPDRDNLEFLRKIKVSGITGEISFADSKISPRTQPVLRFVGGNFIQMTDSPAPATPSPRAFSPAHVFSETAR